jgi:hypothetical protein
MKLDCNKEPKKLSQSIERKRSTQHLEKLDFLTSFSSPRDGDASPTTPTSNERRMNRATSAEELEVENKNGRRSRPFQHLEMGDGVYITFVGNSSSSSDSERSRSRHNSIHSRSSSEDNYRNNNNKKNRSRNDSGGSSSEMDRIEERLEELELLSSVSPVITITSMPDILQRKGRSKSDPEFVFEGIKNEDNEKSSRGGISGWLNDKSSVFKKSSSTPKRTSKNTRKLMQHNTTIITTPLPRALDKKRLSGSFSSFEQDEFNIQENYDEINILLPSINTGHNDNIEVLSSSPKSVSFLSPRNRDRKFSFSKILNSKEEDKSSGYEDTITEIRYEIKYEIKYHFPILIINIHH